MSKFLLFRTTHSTSAHPPPQAHAPVVKGLSPSNRAGTHNPTYMSVILLFFSAALPGGLELELFCLHGPELHQPTPHPPTSISAFLLFFSAAFSRAALSLSSCFRAALSAFLSRLVGPSPSPPAQQMFADLSRFRAALSAFLSRLVGPPPLLLLRWWQQAAGVLVRVGVAAVGGADFEPRLKTPLCPS